MIPQLCLEAVCLFLEEHLRQYRVPSSDGDRAVTVYPYFLPEPPQGVMNPHAEDGTPLPNEEERRDAFAGLMPAVIVRPLKWGDPALDDNLSELTVCVTVGVHSRDPLNRDGAQAIVNLLEHMRQAFLSYRVLNSRYVVQTPIAWELFNEELRPLWFGEMTVTFNILEPARIVGQDWQGNAYGGDFK